MILYLETNWIEKCTWIFLLLICYPAIKQLRNKTCSRPTKPTLNRSYSLKWSANGNKFPHYLVLYNANQYFWLEHREIFVPLLYILFDKEVTICPNGVIFFYFSLTPNDIARQWGKYSTITHVLSNSYSHLRGEVTKGEVWDESREGPHRSHVCCDNVTHIHVTNLTTTTIIISFPTRFTHYVYILVLFETWVNYNYVKVQQ